MAKKATTLTPGWGCYVRLSDEDKQHPEFSLASQRRSIETALLDPSDLPVFHWYEDRLSGRSPRRPGYQQLLADARAGRFSHLAVSRADRFGRDILVALTAVDELLKLGITIKIADMPGLDVTTPDGFFMAIIRLGLAHHESDRTSVRVRERMQEKMLSGWWPWKAPDGYLNVEERVAGTTNKYRRWIETDPDRFPLVRWIRREFATGRYTLSEMCELLHERGDRRGSGLPWVTEKGPAIQSLHKLLTNEFYAGWLVSEKWGIRTRGNHEPTDDDATHARIQQALRAHDHGRVRRRRHVYLLSDVLWSAEADTRFYVTTSRGKCGGEYRYYYTRVPVDGHRVYLRCDEVDAIVPEILAAIQPDPAQLPVLQEEYTERIHSTVENDRGRQEAILKRRVSQLEQEELRIARLLVAGQISEAAHAKLRAEWKGKLIAARLQLEQLQRDRWAYIRDLDDAVTLLSLAADIYRTGNVATKDKKSLVEVIARRIIVDRDGELVRVDLHPPFAFLARRVRELSTRVAPRGKFSNPAPADLSQFTFPTRDLLARSPTLLAYLESADFPMLRA